MPGRNEPCPCGSGKKYKKCCLEHKGERTKGSVRRTEPGQRPEDDEANLRHVHLILGRFTYSTNRESWLRKALTRALELSKKSESADRYEHPRHGKGNIFILDGLLVIGSYSFPCANLLKDRVLEAGGDVIAYHSRESRDLTQQLLTGRLDEAIITSGPTLGDSLHRQGLFKKVDKFRADYQRLDHLYGGDALLEETSASNAVRAFLANRKPQVSPARFRRDEEMLGAFLDYLDEHGWDLLGMERLDAQLSQGASYHALLVCMPKFVRGVWPQLSAAARKELEATLSAMIRFWTDEGLLSEDGYTGAVQMVEDALVEAQRE